MLLTCMVRRVYGAGDPSIKSVRTDMSKHDGLPETLVTDVLVIFGSTPLNHGPQILSVGHIRSLPPGTTEVVLRLGQWGEGEQEPSKSKGDSWHIMPGS
jgi:hypothetical protein